MDLPHDAAGKAIGPSPVTVKVTVTTLSGTTKVGTGTTVRTVSPLIMN